jgi:hypothetical protein
MHANHPLSSSITRSPRVHLLLALARRRSALALLLGMPLLLAPRGCEEPGEPSGCFCTREYAPVCGDDGQTYGNACEADCADVRVDHVGECDAGCVCPGIWAPVCGDDGRTYGNECEAACQGVSQVTEGACECAPLLCDVYCEHGHVQDAQGCDTCACNPPPADLCWSDNECGEGAFCDTSVCRSPCDDGRDDGRDEACPAVCYGECSPVPPPCDAAP